MDSIIFQRISELCKRDKTTIKELSEQLHFTESLIRKWKNTSSPSIDKVKQIADHFHVSTDYLIGATDISEPVESLMADRDLISLQRARNKMDNDEKKRMMIIMRAAFDKLFTEEENNDNENN